MGKFTFRKKERLNKEKIIQELFEKGSSFYLYPFKVFFLKIPDSDEVSPQILVSVSKRLFARAVDRNKIKRRIREAYRLNKHEFGMESKVAIAYIYSVKEILPSIQIRERLLKTFKRLAHVEKI
jgi:ribonuclease P protein component